MTDAEYHQLGYTMANELWDYVHTLPPAHAANWLATAIAIAEMACE